MGAKNRHLDSRGRNVPNIISLWLLGVCYGWQEVWWQVKASHVATRSASAEPGSVLWSYKTKRSNLFTVLFFTGASLVAGQGQTCSNKEGLNAAKIVDCDVKGQTVQCPNNGMAPLSPRILTCGKLGSYNLDDQYRWPNNIICGGRYCMCVCIVPDTIALSLWLWLAACWPVCVTVCSCQPVCFTVCSHLPVCQLQWKGLLAINLINMHQCVSVITVTVSLTHTLSLFLTLSLSLTLV